MFKWNRCLGVVLMGASLLVSTAVLAQEVAPKIAVIDVNRVITESARGKQSFESIKKVRDEKLAEGKKLEQDLRDLEKKISDQKFSLSEDKLNELQKQYQEKAISFKRFQDDAERQLDEAQKKELRVLEREIMPVIEQLGRDRQFTMIFNKFQSGLVFAADSIDITDDVIKRFDDAAAAGAGK